MEIVLLGKNDKNNELKSYFVHNGFDTSIIDEISDVRHIRSKENGFLISMENEDLKKDYIIFTEKPIFNERTKEIPENIKTYSITDSRLKEIDNSGLPIVFLLDNDGETDINAVTVALKNAIQIANRNKKVYFLSKTIRTGNDGSEKLYSDARQLGITFLKYIDVDVKYDINDSSFSIIATDIYGEVTIKTAVLAISGAGEAAISVKESFNDMRSKTLIMQGKYYFEGYKSSINGIYILDGVSIEDDMKYIDDVISDIRKLSGEKCEYISIDDGKCAFCYNCFRACPHGALEPDYEKSAMKPILGKCNECGACLSICPANAISWLNEINENIKGSSGLFIFVCENSGGTLLYELKDFTSETGIDIKEIPCGCSIRPEDILKALKQYKKVAVISCFDGACRHIEGTEKVGKAVARTKERLNKLGINSDNIYHLQASWALPEILKENILKLLEDGEKQ